MTPRDADPLHVPDDEIGELRRHRRASLLLAILAGFAILLLAYVAYSAATSRPASVIPSLRSHAQETDRWRAGMPQRDSGVSAHGLGLLHPAESVKPTAGTVAPLCSGLCPTLEPVALRVVRGKASTYGPGWAGWIAWPDGPGWRLGICGAGGCRTRLSNDAGPAKVRQRAGVIIDLDVATFEAVCGYSWHRGLCSVTVAVLGRG